MREVRYNAPGNSREGFALKYDRQESLATYRDGHFERGLTRFVRHKRIAANIRSGRPSGKGRQHDNVGSNQETRAFLRGGHAVADGNGRVFVAHENAQMCVLVRYVQ